MAADLSKTGISVGESAAWRTPGCLFYDTKQNLLDSPIAFFRTGLESPDFCLWIISEPLAQEDAIGALQQSVPNLDRHSEDCRELRPSMLDDLGLSDAIEWQARQFEARTGIVCARDGLHDNLRFNQEQSTAIFGILQETLTNILLHARATRVDIKMAEEAGEFVFTIQDNARGITGIEKSGLGILGMQERARLLGGKLDIQGLGGSVATIIERLPFSPPCSI